MANLTPVASLEAVYQLETTDPVQGGPGGISNRQAQQLLNRDEFILARLNFLLNTAGNRVQFARVEGLGTAAGLNAGTGANNVMQVGAFGVGGESLNSSNLDATINNGGFTVCLPNAANAPAGETGYGMMICWRGTVPSVGTVIQQFAIYGARIYYRQFVADAWVGWQFVSGSNDVGLVSAFAANVAPTGWLRCNGALISRVNFPRLFSVIGTTYGAGDGSTTFALPDLRGRFLRGWDNGAGVDTGRVMGSNQNDDVIAHKHVLQSVYSGGGGVDGFTLASVTNGALGTISTQNISNFGGTETRPKNTAMLYCIKFQ